MILLNEMTIQDLIEVFLKRWWLILLGIVFGGIIAFSITEYLIESTYESKGSMYVTASADELAKYSTQSEINLATRLVDTYKVALKSNSFVGKIREEALLEDKYSLGKLNSMISLEGINETEFLEVKVTSNSPEEANLICSLILANAETMLQDANIAGAVNTIDEASLPVSPASPNEKLNITIGLVLGLLAAIGLSLLLEMMDTSIKDESDLVKNYNIPVVGSIPNLDTLGSTGAYYYGPSAPPVPAGTPADPTKKGENANGTAK